MSPSSARSLPWETGDDAGDINLMLKRLSLYLLQARVRSFEL
jgi:hypothetical protein